jgi:hypothetical protein
MGRLSAMKLSTVVSIIVLLIAASCVRVPQEDQNSPSGKSGNPDPNSNPTAKPDEPNNPTAGLSTPNAVAADAKTSSGQGGTGHLPLVQSADMDRNSGDIRKSMLTADGSSRYEIHESDLSKEVRRLGIPIPDQRDWVLIYSAPRRGIYVTPRYSRFLPRTRELLDVLNGVKATDEERRAILEKLMTGLRTDKWYNYADVDVLMLEVADRHGLASPLGVEYTQRLRQLHDKQPQ